MKVIVLIKSKAGQALVEFVMLLPIILLILFVIIDFASVFYNKNHLEGVLDDAVVMAEKGLSKDKILNSIDEDIDLTITSSNEFTTIVLEKKIAFITPFSNLFFDDGFKINTKRVILNE